jgi:hypothetical protein
MLTLNQHGTNTDEKKRQTVAFGWFAKAGSRAWDLDG